MSAEKIISKEINSLPPSTTPIKSEEVLSSGRVDINDLLARVRKQQKKDNFSNLIFVGMFIALILVFGIILSF
tara:strand:- start:41 stop:259 length:219 start_codon:yes stop_codon:yes gene_type:complete